MFTPRLNVLWRAFACAGLLALAACGGGSSNNAPGGGSNNSGGSSGGSSGGGATLTPGSVALSAATYSTAQTAGSVTITINRTGGSDGAASVNYATADGSAAAGTIYTAKSGTLSWTAGDATAKSFTVALSSTAFTGNETFTVTLSAVAGATLGSMTSATVTVVGSGTSGNAGTGPAALLAAKMGAPSRLLFGLGGQGSHDQQGEILQQSIKVDIYDRYLSGVWPTYNSAPCDYVCVVAKEADAVGAIPMFTLYEMANNGDGNTSVINNTTFMTKYWSDVKLMYTDLATYDKVALVNLEPDFWGYTEQAASNPTAMAAKVTINADCTTLSNNVSGIAACLIAMARKYAPKVYVGFPPASWGGNSTAAVVAYMNLVGAQHADFVVMQTSDRDAGCFELTPQPGQCVRSGAPWYWDETNTTHPNFHDAFAEASAWHTGIGNLPLIWWQTPLGVPSTTPGGTTERYRDNRVHYFLTHGSELVAAGTLGVVFGAGENTQTTIATDNGQYQTLSNQYFAAPTPLP